MAPEKTLTDCGYVRAMSSDHCVAMTRGAPGEYFSSCSY